MVKIEITYDTRNKCLSCRYYAYDKIDWFTGKCINEKFKGNEDRYWNSKKCVHHGRVINTTEGE